MIGLWKLILEISLHGWVSEGTLILLYATKIAEMNDSDQWLFKTYKILKIGWVEKKIWLSKDGEFSKK